MMQAVRFGCAPSAGPFLCQLSPAADIVRRFSRSLPFSIFVTAITVPQANLFPRKQRNPR